MEGPKKRPISNFQTPVLVYEVSSIVFVSERRFSLTEPGK